MLWTLVAICFLQSVALLAGCSVSAWITITAVFVTFALSKRCCESFSEWWRTAGAAFGLMTVSLLLGGLTEDYSYDGNTYHQQAVVLFAEGWNPIYDEGLPGISQWTLHYAKAMELMEASFVAVTGNLESGKGVNLMLIIAPGLIAYALLRSVSRSRRVAVVGAVVASCSPIGIMQAFTFYIDFAKYAFLLVMLMLTVDAFSNYRFRKMALLVGVGVVASLSKFNFFFETGVFFAIVSGWCIYRHNYRMLRRTAVCGLTVMLLTLVVGYHPYITNYLGYGHPLYPLMGGEAVDIMSKHKPDLTIGNRFVDFFISLFHMSWNPSGVDTLGGFTPMMPAVMVFAGAVIWKCRRIGGAAMWWIAVSIVGSCFFFEQSWWARYISQLWLVACVAYYVGAESLPRLNRKWIAGLSVACLCAGGIAAASTLVRSAAFTKFRHDVYAHARAEGVEVVHLSKSARRHFEERGIYYKITSIDLIKPERSVFFYGDACGVGRAFTIVELKDGEAEALVASAPKFLKEYYRRRLVSADAEINEGRRK